MSNSLSVPDVVWRRGDEGAVLGEVAGIVATGRPRTLTVVDADVEHDDDEDEDYV